MRGQTRTGLPSAQRPYFPGDEIHGICLHALEEVNLLPRHPEPIRIERFIEKKFNVVPKYEHLLDGVLGYSEFSRGRIAKVVVNRSLDGEETSVAERRLRTTLAHEAGHCLLHAYLFDGDPATQPLLGDWTIPVRPRVLCRSVGTNASGRYRGNWSEYQANQAIGGLLLPKRLVELAVGPLIETTLMGLQLFDHSRAESAARRLAETFNVNPVVARLRLNEMFPPSKATQLAL